VNLVQVEPQQVGGPDRGIVLIITRVRIDHRINQRVNDPGRGRRAPATHPVTDALGHRQGTSSGKLRGPIVNGLARDAQQLGDLSHRLALFQQEESMDPTDDPS
jgi:hypothetical protein